MTHTTRGIHTGTTVLCNECDGRWRIETQSEVTYILDLDRRTLTRHREPECTARSLPWDDQPVPLVEVSGIRIGEQFSAVFRLDGRNTDRTNRNVTRVVHLP